MKIPIQVEGTILTKFERVFFDYLQRDNKFKRLIVNARKRLSLKINLEEQDKELDVKFTPDRPLRSELYRIKGRTPAINIETPFSVQLEDKVDEIINEYPFIQDWRHGLRMFICGDRFLVSDKNSYIKLRVRNKKYPYLGRFTDIASDEGVKIVLTSKVSKKELRDWIDNNYEIIIKFIDELPNQSKNTSRRNNYQRDKLIVYLRDVWKLPWGKIAGVLTTNGEPETDYQNIQMRIMQAYKDFPSKI